MYKCSLLVLALLLLLGTVSCRKKCHGDPLMYNGKLCASTTWFHDGRQGACGCGTDDTDIQYDWSKAGFTAAANQLYFDKGGKQWCGHTCGTCVNLTTTGGFVNNVGAHTAEGQSYVFMIVDLCPNEAPNLEWCSQTAHHKVNKYGYGAHFDLEDGIKQITAMGWDNPEVTYEVVDCSHAHAQNHKTPSNTMFHHCQCGK